MKPTPSSNWMKGLLAANLLIAVSQLGGCVAYSDEGYYSSSVYGYGWNDPFYGGYYGGYYGGGGVWVGGGGGVDRPGYNPGDRPRPAHPISGLGPGSGANVRPSYGGGGFRGGGGRR